MSGKRTDEHQQYIIQYLKSGPIDDIEKGIATVHGRHEDGSINAIYESETRKTPTTQWDHSSHNSEHYGTGILKSLLPGRQFPFPKSLYAVEDCIKFFVEDNRDAIILDFLQRVGDDSPCRDETQPAGWRKAAVYLGYEQRSGG